MTVYNWLTLLGVPALLAVIVKLIYNSIKGVKMGVQALLRAQMIDDFNRYSENGYAPIYARENFENCYQQYHRLGANGVMDDLRIMALPTRG